MRNKFYENRKAKTDAFTCSETGKLQVKCRHFAFFLNFVLIDKTQSFFYSLTKQKVYF